MLPVVFIPGLSVVFSVAQTYFWVTNSISKARLQVHALASGFRHVRPTIFLAKEDSPGRRAFQRIKKYTCHLVEDVQERVH